MMYSHDPFAPRHDPNVLQKLVTTGDMAKGRPAPTRKLPEPVLKASALAIDRAKAAMRGLVVAKAVGSPMDIASKRREVEIAKADLAREFRVLGYFLPARDVRS